MKIILTLLSAFAFLPSVLFGDETTPVRLVMQLDWKPNAQFAGILLAKENGWYQEAGIDLDVRPVPDDGGIARSVAESDHALGSAESSGLLTARGAGLPVKALATMFQGTPQCLVSLDQSNISTLSDLAGKRIGLHGDGGAKLLALVFGESGLPLPAYTAVEAGYDASEIVIGKADAVQAYVIDEYVQLKNAGKPVRALLLGDHGYVAYSQMIFTSEKALALHSDAIGKFLQVTRRGWLAAFDDPETTAKMIVAKYQPDLDPGYQALSLREIQKLMTRETGADHPELLLHVNPATVEKNRALLEKYQIAQVPPDSSGLLDLRFQTQPVSSP